MKKNFLIYLLLGISCSLFASKQYDSNSYTISYGNGKQNGSINVLQNLDSFSFTTNFGSIGNSGSIGYYTYTDNPANYTLGDQMFNKKGGNTIDLGALSAGQKVGFFLQRKNGDIIGDFHFSENNGKYSLTFDKNNGHGKDEGFAFDSITVGVSGGGNAPSGQPLPGVIAGLLIGVTGIGLSTMKKKKQK